MATTTFSAGTVIESSWLNDVNAHVYNGNSYDDISIVNVLDPSIGFVNDGTTDNATVLATLLASGKTRIYVPKGTYAIASPLTATLTADVYIFGEGKFIYTGTNNTNPLVTIQSSNYNVFLYGVTFDGDDKIAGGVKIENTSAMSSTAPECTLQRVKLQNFRMNSTSIWNLGAYIAGSFTKVNLFDNQVTDITRAAGTGSPGVNGTTGIYVTNYDATKIVVSCEHAGNVYTNISGDDLVASADNVDFDGFKFFAPNPTNGDNVDATVSSYVPSTCWSHNNTYRNVRGRAAKIQALANVHDEKIIRDADYTITGGSTEINLQYGAGTVRDIEFFYKDYAGPTSPIQTDGHVLVGFAQNAWYDEDHGGISVSGLRVYNNIKAGIGQPIAQVLNAQVSGTALGKDRLLVRLSDVVVNRGNVGWLVTISGDTGAAGMVVLQDISVAKLLYSAVGTSYANPSIKLVANNVFNLDGVDTPANAKNFITNTVGPGNNISFTGAIHGSNNHGFLNTYNRGADFTAAPMLVGGALTGTGFGGAASVQTVRLADDASHTFERRFFNQNRGLIVVSVDFDYTSQGVFAIGSNGVYQIAAHASDVFTPSTTGSNIDTVGQLNLWFTGGQLSVKNRLGATYSVTVMFIG